MLLNPLIFWRRYPDLNQGITVLQTVALALGHTAIHFSIQANIKNYSLSIKAEKDQYKVNPPIVKKLIKKKKVSMLRIISSTVIATPKALSLPILLLSQ